MFQTGVVLRFQHNETLYLQGRVLYCVNIIFWYIRLMELFAVNKSLGPYVVIIGKLVCYIVQSVMSTDINALSSK